jgi:hypothetical protein
LLSSEERGFGSGACLVLTPIRQVSPIYKGPNFRNTNTKIFFCCTCSSK